MKSPEKRLRHPGEVLQPIVESDLVLIQAYGSLEQVGRDRRGHRRLDESLSPRMSIDGPRYAPHLAMVGKLPTFPRTWGYGGQAFVSADQSAALERITQFVAEKPEGAWRSPHPLALRFEAL